MDFFTTIFDTLATSGFVGFLLVFGFVLAAHRALDMLESFLEERRNEQQPPSPKSREYRVVVEDADGWPLRSYSSLPAETVGRLLRDIEHGRQK